MPPTAVGIPGAVEQRNPSFVRRPSSVVAMENLECRLNHDSASGSDENEQSWDAAKSIDSKSSCGGYFRSDSSAIE